MLEFADRPYAFIPAKPVRPFMWLCRHINRRHLLPGAEHRIAEVEVRRASVLEEARQRAPTRWLFLVNHPSHSDPQVMVEVQRQLGQPSCYMAAYDVFERSKVASLVMQYSGCFSINRDGNDSRAMREAIRILTSAPFALTIFPEGNVYLMNDRVSPFLDGAAFIGMKAQKQLGPEQPLMVVPVSIKLTHTADVRPSIKERLGRLAKDLGTAIDDSVPLNDEVKRIGMTALERSLKQRGLMPQEPGEGEVRGHLEHCATLMIERLEHKMGLRSKPRHSLSDRIRQIRSRIHKIRTDPNARADHQVAVTWADEAMLALRILSYAGNYLDESPTVDRFAESVDKLLEDVYSELQPPHGDRRALVHINPPINLAEHLETFATNARQCVSDLTNHFETSIQSGLDAIAQDNPHPGNQAL
jgi:1-acyl-sn-glycerol-3-phosphate acyltransferase